VSIPWSGNAWGAGCQINLGLAAPKEEVKQGTKMRWGRLVPERLRPVHELVQECDNIAGRNVVEIAEFRTETERHEAIKAP